MSLELHFAGVKALVQSCGTLRGKRKKGNKREINREGGREGEWEGREGEGAENRYRKSIHESCCCFVPSLINGCDKLAPVLS